MIGRCCLNMVSKFPHGAEFRPKTRGGEVATEMQCKIANHVAHSGLSRVSPKRWFTKKAAQSAELL